MLKHPGGGHSTPPSPRNRRFFLETPSNRIRIRPIPKPRRTAGVIGHGSPPTDTTTDDMTKTRRIQGPGLRFWILCFVVRLAGEAGQLRGVCRLRARKPPSPLIDLTDLRFAGWRYPDTPPCAYRRAPRDTTDKGRELYSAMLFCHCRTAKATVHTQTRTHLPPTSTRACGQSPLGTFSDHRHVNQPHSMPGLGPNFGGGNSVTKSGARKVHTRRVHAGNPRDTLTPD